MSFQLTFTDLLKAAEDMARYTDLSCHVFYLWTLQLISFYSVVSCFLLSDHSQFLGPLPPPPPHPPPLAYFPLLLLKHQWLLVFFIFLCVICFLKLPLNSLFDSFLSASCEKHFVFITRQHLFCPSWLSLYSLPELAQ